MNISFKNNLTSTSSQKQNINKLSVEKKAEFKKYGYNLTGEALGKSLICGAVSTVPISLFAKSKLSIPKNKLLSFTLNSASALAISLYSVFELMNIKKRKEKLEELKK